MAGLSTTTAIKSIIDTPKYYNKFRRIHSILIQATLPYIFSVACVGLITNTATIVLLSKSFVTSNTRHKWTLIALALSDLVHNSALSIRVIHDITKGKMEYLCLVISFLSHLAELLSACYTVLFTIQRYRAVRYPLEAAVHKKSSPLVIIFLLFLTSFILCLALLHANTYIDCHEELQLNWFIADALFSFIIPFSLILIFNLRIVHLIQRHARSSISKQSIMLRPRKLRRNKKNCKGERGSRQEESHSMIELAGNSLTLNGPLSEPEIENKCSSIISSNQKKNNESNPTSAQETQASDIAIPLSPIEKDSSDAGSTSSPRPSVKSENSITKKVFSRKDSHQSDELFLSPNNDSHTSQSIRVTRMLVLVSTCFLILNAPAHLCVIGMKIYIGIDAQVYSEHVELEHFQRTTNLTSNQLKNFVFIQTNENTSHQNQHVTVDDIQMIDDNLFIHLFYIAIQITQWISYASYSINFFLYSFSGITFRTGLRQFWKKLRKH